jgi:VWFA-related protein
MRYANKFVTISVILCAPFSAAQNSSQSAASSAPIKAGVEFVQVPVVVQRGGKHLPGLSKNDFSLQQDGKQQPLASFEEIHATTSTTAKQDAASFGNGFASGGATPQIVMLAIDTVNTSPFDQAYFRDELKKYFAQMKPTDSPLGLVELTRGGLHVLHDFTRDAGALMSGLDKAHTVPAKNNDTSSVLSKAANEQQQRDEGLADQNPDMEQRLDALLAQEDQVSRFQDSTTRIDSLLALQQLAQMLKGIPGRKTLLWAGSGFPFASLSSTNAAGQRSLAPDRAGSALDLHAYTWKLLNDANVAVYPIDTRRTTNTAYDVMDVTNKYSPTYRQKEMARDADSDTQATLLSVAEKTGGKACIGRTDLHNCIREAADDNRDYYLLGFYVDKSNHAPGWHKVTIKLDQKASLRYREGFIIQASKPDQVRNTDLQLALNSAFAYTSLPFTGRFLSFTPEGDNKNVNFQLRIPPNAISLEDAKIDFDILAVVRAPGGKETARISQHISQTLPPQGVATIQAQGINYTNKLAVPPGEYGVWFVLRDNPTGRTGSVTVPLKVQ